MAAVAALELAQVMAQVSLCCPRRHLLLPRLPPPGLMQWE
jgi:hypothetical protein